MLPSAAGLLFRRGLKSLRMHSAQSFREEPKPERWRSQSRRPSAAGRMISPEAVTDSKAGYERQTHAEAKSSSAPWLWKFIAKAATFEPPNNPKEDLRPPPQLHAGKLMFAGPSTRTDRREKAAGLTTRSRIAAASDSGSPNGTPGRPGSRRWSCRASAPPISISGRVARIEARTGR